MSDSFHSPFWYRLSELKPRLKPHVDIALHDYLGEPWYVLHDRVTGKVHRFSATAYAVIGAMNGRARLDEIWRGATERLDADAPSQNDVVQLMSQLYQADLLSVDGVPEAEEVLERMRKKRSQKRQRFFKNPMSIPLPLFDPDRLLDRLAPLVRGRVIGLVWLFGWLAVVLPALALVPASMGPLSATGPREWLALDNLVLMACVYPVVKLVHELAHGLAVKRHGGEVHEVGIMFLVFFPVPYVDASSSAFFSSKGARALVGAAGILAEVWLASAAFLIWLAIEPGLARDIMFNVMLIGGISTILVNGNPLLKFDGYFVTCDLAEIPNLGNRANAYWGHLAKTLLLGIEDPGGRPRMRRERIVFFLYAPAAFVYRLAIMLTIAAMVASHYFIVGVALALWSMFQGFILPIFKVAAKFFTDSKLAEKRGLAGVLAVLGVGIVAAALFVVPVPHRETTQGVVWLPENTHVRATGSGLVVDLPFANGALLEPGDIVAAMENGVIETELRVQRARLDEAAVVAGAEQFRNAAAYRLAEERLNQERARFEVLTGRLQDMIAPARIAGRLFVPDPERLLGRFVREGELIGYILPPGADTIRAALPQGMAEFLDDRLEAITVLPADDPQADLPARLLRRVPAATNALPSPALASSGGGPFAVDPSDPDAGTTLDRLVQVDLLAPAVATSRFGTRVFVKFDFGWEPLGYRLYRGMRLTLLRFFSGG